MMFNYATNFVMIEEGVVYEITYILYKETGYFQVMQLAKCSVFSPLSLHFRQAYQIQFHLRATVFNIYFYFTSPQSQLAVPTSSAAPMASASQSVIPAMKRRTVPMVLTSSQAVAVSISPAWPISQRY